MKTWEVGILPFFYKHQNSPSNVKFPDKLPFTLYEDWAGLLRRTPQSLDIIKEAYEEGSELSGLMDHSGIGKEYAKRFINFMLENLGDGFFFEKTVLEIGCGTGYLLSRLKDFGANVLGVEPGNFNQIYRVPIVKDFFPSEHIKQKFNVVIAFCVLEHVEDIHKFLLGVKEILEPTGKFILAVEDEEPYIQAGDMSILFHEHLSYFTKDSLSRCLIGDGFDNVRVYQEKSHAILYSFCDPTGSYIQSFREKSERAIERFRKVLLDNTGKKIGIYIPGRAINMLEVIGSPDLRFFDDNPKLHNKFLPGFNNPIEDRNDLLRDPPDIIFIMSYSFGDKIAQELKEILSKKVVIKTWKDVFDAKDQSNTVPSSR